MVITPMDKNRSYEGYCIPFRDLRRMRDLNYFLFQVCKSCLISYKYYQIQSFLDFSHRYRSQGKPECIMVITPMDKNRSYEGYCIPFRDLRRMRDLNYFLFQVCKSCLISYKYYQIQSFFYFSHRYRSQGKPECIMIIN